MATTQFAYQDVDNTPTFAQLNPLSATDMSIALEHISVSQLLGRDYVFIDVNFAAIPSDNSNAMKRQFEELVRYLELTEAHTVIVSVDDKPVGETAFVRHDLSWYKHSISKIECFAITNNEQRDFMNMIWQCSTPALD